MGLNPERCWEVDPKPLVRRRSSPRRCPPCEGGWRVTRDHMASALLRARCGGTTLGQGPVGGSLGSWMKEQPLGSGSAYAAPPHLPRPPARPLARAGTAPRLLPPATHRVPGDLLWWGVDAKLFQGIDNLSSGPHGNQVVEGGRQRVGTGALKLGDSDLDVRGKGVGAARTFAGTRLDKYKTPNPAKPEVGGTSK